MNAQTGPEAVASADADALASGQRLLELINASWTTQAIYAAVELRTSGPARRRSAAGRIAC